MSLILNLEAMAGDTIEDTCYEMVSIASSLNICVQVQFNDVTLISFCGGDADDLAGQYVKQVSSRNKYKTATTR